MISLLKIDYSNAIFYSRFSACDLFELTAEDSTPSVVYGADYNSEPCGVIAVKQHKTKTHVWELKSLFVNKKFRRKGVATALLNKIISELSLKDCKTINFKYITSQKTIDEFSFFLLPMGFSPLEKLTTVYRFNAKTLLQNSNMVSWASRGLFKLPENVKIVSMDELDLKLLDELKTKIGIDYPENLSPFKNEYNLKRRSSFFAINSKNEIIGWLTGLSGPRNSILYRSFFVMKEFRETAVGFFIFNEAVKYNRINCINNDFLFAIPCENDHAERFISLYFKGANYKSKKYEFETSFNF